MDTFYSSILVVHIIAGFAAFFSAFVAIYTKIFEKSHSWHVISGRIFFYGMALVFITTLLLTWIRPNIFLTLIGFFSFYLAFMGWRLAVNRSGVAHLPEFLVIYTMILAGIVMVILGIYSIVNQNSNGITLTIFGGIGLMLAISQLKEFKKIAYKGKERIASHLGFMMGAFIAAITAFLVTNFSTNPGWILWVLPTLVITPLIFRMTGKVRK